MNFTFNYTVTEQELKEGRFFVADLPDNKKIYARKETTLHILVFQYQADMLRSLFREEASKQNREVL